MTYETRDVLGGAYRGGRRALTDLLTHTVELDEAGNELRVLCRKVRLDHMADRFAGDVSRVPTCFTCASRDPRLRRPPVQAP